MGQLHIRRGSMRVISWNHRTMFGFVTLRLILALSLVFEIRGSRPEQLLEAVPCRECSVFLFRSASVIRVGCLSLTFLLVLRSTCVRFSAKPLERGQPHARRLDWLTTATARKVLQVDQFPNRSVVLCIVFDVLLSFNSLIFLNNLW